MIEEYAVLDLGSNSFRLLLARRQGELLRVVERVKEKVQLARDFRDGRLDAAALDRAQSCLRRYAQRLIGLPRTHVAMVGTHALRAGNNRAELVDSAEAILGVPLRILSGEEEAALIFRGVQEREPPAPGVGRLVIDIGGGSTEFAWGGASAPLALQSMLEGCVSLGDRFFRQGRSMQHAFDAARAYLRDVVPAFDPVDPGMEVVGTSGTIESVQSVLTANGWSDRSITPQGLAELVEALCGERWSSETGVLGLAPERIDIFPAGVVLLDVLFRRIGISSMRHVGAALEDGVLYQMLFGDGRVGNIRHATLRGLASRFGIDAAQAGRVRSTALVLFDAVCGDWPFPVGAGDPDWRELLAAAAELHELGLLVAPRGYHRHGAYLLRHADLLGFSATEREYLALLVRAHRRGMPAVAFSGLGFRDRRICIRLAALLRIAVILERSHASGESPGVQVVAQVEPDCDRLQLTLPRGWLEAHPLSLAELGMEPAQLAASGIRFAFEER